MAEKVTTRGLKVSVCNLGVGYAHSSEYAARITSLGRATWRQIHPRSGRVHVVIPNLTQRD